jgi:hypothetical protein
MEASATSGLPGRPSGLGGFSVNRVTRLRSSTDSTPYSRALATGTSTAPMVMSAPLSTWKAIIGP